MWIWNDYLLPYLTLDLGKYKTVSVAVQYLKGGYGSVDMGAMMACLVLAVIPIIVFYLVCQKYIVSGVMAGAVKGDDSRRQPMAGSPVGFQQAPG